MIADSGVYQVEMFAKNSRYVALGFSEDRFMVIFFKDLFGT